MENLNSKIKELKEKRQNINETTLKEIRAIEVEKRTAEDSEKLKRAADEFIQLTTQIEQLETEERLNAIQAKESEAKEDRAKPTDDEKRYLDVMNKYLRKGVNGLNSEERSILEKRVMSVGTPSEGGYLVPTQWAEMITERQVAMGPMLKLGTIMPSDSGSTMAFPTNDDSSNAGEWLAEKSAATEGDLVLSSLDIATHVIDSKVIKVQKQLLQDNGFNLESFIANKFGERIGRGLNVAMTTGNGTGKPYGVVTGAGVNVAAQAAASISRTDFATLKHTVNSAYHANSAFMINQSTMLAVILLAIGTNDDRPLYQPNPNVGQPDMLEGSPVYLNPDMASIGASSVSVLFGDFKQYIIRNVPKGRSLLRMEELYATYYQTGFILFERWGGRLIDTYAIGKLTHPSS